MIRIGYACINTQLPTANRTCRVANAAHERIIELGRANLAALAEILRWNAARGIRVFRISSDIIPLASHPALDGLAWWDALLPELREVGELIAAAGMRVSMHPGQYTVLNSPRAEVVRASLAELEYHARLLTALGAPASAKLVLHLGGVYGDKPEAVRRFVDQFTRLSADARGRVVLENDEKSYTAADVLGVSRLTGAPVVFDVFHHACNPSMTGLSLREIVECCAATWQPSDGPPKLHYSDQQIGKQPGAHAQSIDLEAFGRTYRQLEGLDLDIMLEVKDKERSALAVYEYLPELRPPGLAHP